MNAAETKVYEAELKKFDAWRKAQNATVPALAARVFALRGRMYAGAGFHWGMERHLGKVLALLNDFDSHEFYAPGAHPLALRIGLKVSLEMLRRDVSAAERSAAKWDAKNR